MAEYFTPTFFAPESNIRKAFEDGQICTDRPTCLVDSNVASLTAYKILRQSEEKPFMDFIAFLLSERCAGHRLVWAGDYGNPISVSLATENIVHEMYDKEHKVRYTEFLLESVKSTGKYDPKDSEKRRVITDLDRREYVTVPTGDNLNPLPFLTYDGEDSRLIRRNVGDSTLGRWRGDRLIAQENAPDGFIEISATIPPVSEWKQADAK